jgi:hypothetical protein
LADLRCLGCFAPLAIHGAIFGLFWAFFGVFGLRAKKFFAGFKNNLGFSAKFFGGFLKQIRFF